MKASVELCIYKFSDAAAKSELKANCEKFDSELAERRTSDGSADSCVSIVVEFCRSYRQEWMNQLPRHLFA